MTPRDDFDPLAPQREAAFFYGLFLRGHSVDALRQDIDVPRVIIDKWVKAKDFQGCLPTTIWIAFTNTANAFWPFSTASFRTNKPISTCNRTSPARFEPDTREN